MPEKEFVEGQHTFNLPSLYHERHVRIHGCPDRLNENSSLFTSPLHNYIRVNVSGIKAIPNRIISGPSQKQNDLRFLSSLEVVSGCRTFEALTFSVFTRNHTNPKVVLSKISFGWFEESTSDTTAFSLGGHCLQPRLCRTEEHLPTRRRSSHAGFSPVALTSCPWPQRSKAGTRRDVNSSRPKNTVLRRTFPPPSYEGVTTGAGS